MNDNNVALQIIDHLDLDLVCGGLAKPAAAAAAPATNPPKKASYGNMCARGAIDGGLAGLSGAASFLPIVALSGPVSPEGAAVVLGGGAAAGAATGCASGMWELHKARNPIEP